MTSESPRFLRYAIAFSLALLAAFASLTMEHSIGVIYYWPFFAAITLAAWFGGLGPGLVTTMICGGVVDYFFEQPHHLWSITERGTLVRLLGFTATAFIICALTEQRRAAYHREARAHLIAADAVRARDFLLATVAHDLRSPVSVILMRAQLLQHARCQCDVAGPLDDPERVGIN